MKIISQKNNEKNGSNELQRIISNLQNENEQLKRAQNALIENLQNKLSESRSENNIEAYTLSRELLAAVTGNEDNLEKNTAKEIEEVPILTLFDKPDIAESKCYGCTKEINGEQEENEVIYIEEIPDDNKEVTPSTDVLRDLEEKRSYFVQRLLSIDDKISSITANKESKEVQTPPDLDNTKNARTSLNIALDPIHGMTSVSAGEDFQEGRVFKKRNSTSKKSIGNQNNKPSSLLPQLRCKGKCTSDKCKSSDNSLEDSKKTCVKKTGTVTNQFNGKGKCCCGPVKPRSDSLEARIEELQLLEKQVDVMRRVMARQNTHSDALEETELRKKIKNCQDLRAKLKKDFPAAQQAIGQKIFN